MFYPIFILEVKTLKNPVKAF
jgi:hypothetical protein